MAADVLDTFELTVDAESVRDVIERIDSVATVFTTSIGRSTARAMREEWPERAYETPGDNAQLETGAAPTPAANQPGMKWNAVQTLSRTASVSTASDAVKKYGMESALADEIQQKLVRVHRDEEFAMIGQITEPTADAGFLSTGAGFGGIENTTNPARMISIHGLMDDAVRDQAGGAFSEAKVRALQQVIFENTRESANKILLVTPADQVIADDFSGKTEVVGTDGIAATRVRTINDNEVDVSIQYFNTSFGRLSVMPSTFILSTTALLYDPGMTDVCELEPLQALPLHLDTAKANARECFSRCTLRLLNSFSAGSMEGLT